MNIALTPDEIAVTIAGGVLILFLLWYFLGPQRAPKRPATADSQEVVVTVLGGYEPASIVLSRGVPAKLRFQREEENECSQELLIPHFGIKRTLPAFKTTTIDLQPDEIGEFEFHCGKGVMKGKIVVVNEGPRG